jgi:hypothetical protein
MRQGSTLTALAQELKSIRDESADYSVPVNMLDRIAAKALTAPSAPAHVETISVDEVIAATEAKARIQNGLAISMRNGTTHDFVPSPFAHGQIAEYAGVPKGYYDRLLLENSDLLATNINHGFAISAGLAASKKDASGRLLRTHKGKLRALLSTRYRRLDNHNLIEAVLPVLSDLGFDFNEGTAGSHDRRNHNSYELTDKRLYLKLTSPRIQAEVQRGQVVQYGLVISNSDVGAGSVRVELMLLILACENGLIMDNSLRQHHLGRNQAGDDIEALLSDATKELSDKAFFATVRDVIMNTAKPEVFEAAVNKLREAANVPIRNFDLPQIVTRTLSEIGVSASERVRESMLDNLASGAHGSGMNKWGVSNAATWAAGNAEGLSYEDATELERAGNKILDLSGKQWDYINAR